MSGSVCDSLIGIKELETENIKLNIFPNPCTSSFSVDLLEQNDAIKYLFVEEVLGKIVFAKSGSPKKYDISFLLPGIYIVYVLTHKGNKLQSMLIKE